MVVEPLEKSVIARIRSSSAIDSVTQCVIELVLNSLDAKATAIAVRVNLATFRIQVVDNGQGISHSNLEFVGQRYMTNKCHSLVDLKKHLKYHGFKGEALASISQISQRVTVITREQNSEETFIKVIEKDETTINLTKSRASCGTTVTVEGFLNNLPVRQQCVKNNELENVKRNLESLVIIYPRVSFTLRNDLGATLILSSEESPDIASSFKTIHPEINENEFALLKVSKNRTNVEGLIYMQLHETKRLQYLYVNKRPINSPEIQNFLNLLFKNFPKIDPKKKNPVYVIHIKCPYSDIDIVLEPSKTSVFFRKIDIVKRCLQKMINAFMGGGNIEMVTKKSKVSATLSEFGVSQIHGAVKGFGTKRKNDELDEEISNKSAKIIEDTPYFEEPKIMSKQTKVALPIEVKRSEKKKLEEDAMQDDNFVENKDTIEPKEVAMNNSLYTNFPENEKTGKDVIMDMFIMSLQVFPPEDKEISHNVDNCDDQFAETSPENTTSPKVTMGIQTTFDLSVTKDNMVSVGIQAGSSNINQILDNNITFPPRKSLRKYVSDYNFDFSKVDSTPYCHMKKKFDTHLPIFKNFNQTKPLFDFRNTRSNDNRAFFENFEQPTFPLKFLPQENETILENVHKQLEKKCEKKRMLYNEPLEVKQSPYFSKIAKSSNILAMKKLPESDNKENYEINKPVCKCDYKNQILDHTIIKDTDLTFIKKRNNEDLNETTVSKYFTPKGFKNCKFRIQTPKLPNVPFEETRDLFSFDNSLESRKSESQLFITLNNMETMKKGLHYDNNLEDDDEAPTLTAPQSMWRNKEVDIFENKLYSSKKDISFQIAERFDFVPKGLSPILKDFGKVDDMSPKSKQQLQNALIKSYEDELLMIKWQNFIDNKDPKTFFEEIYLEKSKLIEGEIPNAYTKYVKDFENISFTKKLFKNVEVIGQVDCKFIAVLEKSRNLIVLFDQHAVHERVRLEELSEGYKNTSTKLTQNITIFVQKDDLTLLKRQYNNLKLLGLVLDFFMDGLTIYEVPLCIYNKSKKGTDIVFLTQALIKEIIEILRSNNEIIVHTPCLIQNIVNSEACRGAIKFGDLLTKNECLIHLKNLANCKLPFQCAHGRPTLTPLIYLNKLYDDIFVSKPKLSNL